jgi:hypothetical protein
MGEPKEGPSDVDRHPHDADAHSAYSYVESPLGPAGVPFYRACALCGPMGAWCLLGRHGH